MASETAYSLHGWRFKMFSFTQLVHHMHTHHRIRTQMFILNRITAIHGITAKISTLAVRGLLHFPDNSFERFLPYRRSACRADIHDKEQSESAVGTHSR